MYPKASNQYPGDEEVALGDEELGEERVETNVVRMISKDNSDEDDDDEDDTDEEDEVDEENVDYDDNKRYSEKGKEVCVGKPRKKRKLKSLISNYEFAPRVHTPPVEKATISQPSSGEQNSLEGWSEVETFALLDEWGERFLRRGRESLRAEEWKEVSEKVSQGRNIERTDAQCRNRLDTLKKKYKKEKANLMTGESGDSKWVYYKRMDMLLSTAAQQQTALSCGIDSGKYVFSSPNVYLNRANGLDEMRDTPANSDSQMDEEEDSDELPPKRKKKRRRRVKGSSVGLLADSIQKFSEMYEKIESNKTKQIQELERMRMDFYRQLETQRWETLRELTLRLPK